MAIKIFRYRSYSALFRHFYLFSCCGVMCVCVGRIRGMPPAPSPQPPPPPHPPAPGIAIFVFLPDALFFFLDILQRCWRKSAFICMHGYALYLSACLALILGVLLVLASQDAFVPPRFPLLPLFPPFP